MKILHLGNLKSGIDTYVRNVVAKADGRFEFVIVSGADDNSQPYIRHGEALKNYRISMYRALNPFKDLKAVWQTVRIIRKEKADAVHCHSAKGGMVGRIAGLFTSTRVFYTPHAFSFLSARSKLQRALFLAFERAARLNSTLVACSESERRLGISEVGYGEQKAKVWSNSIPAIRPEDIKQPQGLDPDERFIVSIGRPSYQKNPLLMVETMRRVHDRHPRVKFCLVGVGFYSPMLGDMKALVSRYKLDGVIRLLPWLSHEETIGYLRHSLFYLTTSLYEGLPIAVLEAMAMGKAVVATDVIGNSDCVRDGVNGFLLPSDADALAEKVCRLIEDEAERERMGKASKSIFERDFLIDNRIKALEEIYLTACQKAREIPTGGGKSLALIHIRAALDVELKNAA